MLEHLGQPAAAAAIESAVEKVLGAENIRTADLDGTATTAEMTQAIVAAIA